MIEESRCGFVRLEHSGVLNNLLLTKRCYILAERCIMENTELNFASEYGICYSNLVDLFTDFRISGNRRVLSILWIQ